jgi:hypothetical protein
LKRLVCVFAALSLAHPAVGEERPTGTVVCSAGGQDVTISFVEREKLPAVELGGLPYGSGSYLFNEQSVVVYAPEDCLADTDDDALVFSGCQFTGILDRIDGSFTFRNGDDVDSAQAVFLHGGSGSCSITPRRF